MTKQDKQDKIDQQIANGFLDKDCEYCQREIKNFLDNPKLTEIFFPQHRIKTSCNNVEAGRPGRNHCTCDACF